MAKADADRNLLFGIVALQMDFISRDQLVAGLNAWVLRKADPLAQVLQDHGVLSESRRLLLEPLVAEHLRAHGGDVERSLVAVAAQMSTRLPTGPVEDPDVIQALETMGHPASATAPDDDDPYRTRSYTPADAGGRYRILRQHAKGGLGIVFLAHDTELNRQVALKEIQGHYADDAESRARFVSEAEITGGLEHPGIVPVYGLGSYADGRPFYAMRFIKGNSLKDAIERFPKADNDPKRDPGERALELQKLLRRFLDVCEAIAYAHSRGVLHRDLKPGNVMVGRYGETLVVDWGLAKVIGRGNGQNEPSAEVTLRPNLSAGSSATLPGSALGTPAYMSPEQAEGRLEKLGPASDVYSLGATLYSLLTGRAPFGDGDLGENLRRVAAGEFPHPRQVNPRVPASLEAICLKAMAVRPGDRYRGAKELAADIEKWLADEPVSAAPEGFSQRLARWARRHRAGVQAATVALMVLGIISVAFLVVVDRARRGEQAGRREALGQKRKAELALAEVERQAALVLLERGLTECSRGSAQRGILWLAGALERAPRGDEGLQRLIRTNLASWSREAPVLKEQLQHAGHVFAVEFSPDGKAVVTGCQDNTARLWDAATGKPIGAPMVHENSVRAVAFSPDGKAVLTGSQDKTARLWDTATGKPIGAPMKNKDFVIAVAFSPDGKAVLTGSSYTARLWDAATGKPIGAPMVHKYQVSAVAFSPDGNAVLTGSQDNTARLWDAATGKPIGAPMEHQKAVTAVAFSPDGKAVLTGSDDHTARLWDAATGKPIGAVMEHKRAVLAGAFSPDGKAVLTGSDDHTARLWDAATGKPIGAPMEHKDAVSAVAFSPDAKAVLTGSQDHTARLWDAATGKPIRAPMEHKDAVSAVAFSPDGTAVVTGCDDQTARLWDAAAGKSNGAPIEHQKAVTAVAFSSDGKAVLTGSNDHTARLWDAATGKPFGAPMEHNDAVRAVASSPDGKAVLTGSDDNTARLWDAATGKPIGALLEHKNAVLAVAFSSDGKAVLTGSNDNTARLWDAATGKPIGAPLEHKDTVWAVAFSPDGKAVLTGSYDYTARLWDTATSNPIGALLQHKNTVRAVAFSPDGKAGLTGSSDRTARLWGAATGKLIGAPMEHKSAVLAVAFSPDGKAVLTGSYDQTARLWDTATGKPTGAPMEHQKAVTAVAFSPDGKAVLTGSDDHTARLWDAATGKPIGAPMEHKDVVRAVTFRPDGEAVLTGSDDHTARLWERSSLLPLEPRVLSNWCHAITGLALDDAGDIQNLEIPRWNAMRAVIQPSRAFASMPGSKSADPRAWHRAEALESGIARNWFAARWHLDRLLVLSPDDGYALSRRARALAKLGLWDAAVADYSKTLGTPLGDAESLVGRAEALANLGRWQEALADCTRLDGLKPDYPAAHWNVANFVNELGVMLRAKGTFGGAIAAFAEAIRMQPDSGEAYNNRASLWATCSDATQRDGKRAIESATRACEMTAWKEPNYLDTLAAAYAEAGDFDAAVKWQTKAIDLASGNDALQKELRARLDLYQAKKPFHDLPPTK